MADDIFAPALATLQSQDRAFFGPYSFKDYLREYEFSTRLKTPEHISIDHFEKLPRSLRDSDTMILRLGEAGSRASGRDSDGTGTQFGLVRVEGQLESFFLFDSKLFEKVPLETFLTPAGQHQLFPFYLLRSTSEANLVNFAFASGLISKALNLDANQEVIIPSTGRSRYSFSFRPHTTIDRVVEHVKGQVEIDSLFVSKRNNIQSLFVLEAKVGEKYKSLAKHKLLYPILSILKDVPIDMPIIPIYLKFILDDEGLHFKMAECHIDVKKQIALDQLSSGVCRHLVIPRNLLGF